MTLEEKKYQVKDFKNILLLLKQKKVKKDKHVISIHYYGQHQGNNVEKYVEYKDKVEIHVLEENQGRFTLIEHKEIKDKKAGDQWLKNKGYKVVNIVKMDYTEYVYKGGTVGLYLINDFLYSVILNYPKEKHKLIEKEFGLDKCEVIKIPYNKLLEKMNKLKSFNLTS